MCVRAFAWADVLFLTLVSGELGRSSDVTLFRVISSISNKPPELGEIFSTTSVQLNITNRSQIAHSELRPSTRHVL